MQDAVCKAFGAVAGAHTCLNPEAFGRVSAPVTVGLYREQSANYDFIQHLEMTSARKGADSAPHASGLDCGEGLRSRSQYSGGTKSNPPSYAVQQSVSSKTNNDC